MLDVLLAATPTDGESIAADIVSLVITAVVSATVFSALITGLIQYLINRRNSRITERKNTVDAESDLVTRYKEAAAEERAAKSSAVETIKLLLAESKEGIETLKGTVKTLNDTIALLKDVNAAQGDVIKQLTADRDRTQAALERAEARVQDQMEQLRIKQNEIEDLLAGSRTRAEAARIVSESFDISSSSVE
jgi:chromosome segregation ATPase